VSIISPRHALVLAVLGGVLLTGCSQSVNGTAAPIAGTTAATRPATSSSQEPTPSDPVTPDDPTPTTTPEPSTPDQSTTDPSTTETSAPESSTDADPSEPATFPEMTIDPSEPDAVEALKVLESAVLTPEDAGEDFVAGTFTPGDPDDHDSVLPCGQPTTTAMFPNGLRTGSQLVLPDSAQLEQSVNLFLDEETAQAAFEWAAEGLNCSTGDLGGTPIEITDEGDVTADVGGDQAHAWTAVIGDQTGVIIGVRKGHLTLGFTFVLLAGVDGSTLPNPVDLAAAGVQKLEDAGY